MSQLNISLLEVVLILVTVRVVGWVFQRLGQPLVIGEMIAGLLLGPSLFGRVFPAAFAFTYPEDSMDVLYTLSRLGVWLFMFLVGVDLDISLIRRVGKLVLITSESSVFVPLMMGSAFALLLYPAFAGPHTSEAPFLLFIGVAMSITAFPVLARILKERGMTHSEIGTMAIACAAVNDITAWCLLAVTVLFIHPASREIAMFYRLGGLLAYFGFMWTVGRPLLKRAAAKRAALEPGFFAGIVLLLFLSGLVTQLIGIHALFGAFFLGVVLPKDIWLTRGLEERIGPLTEALLLPLFFVFSGVRTNLGLITGRRDWALCAALIGVAVLGKFVGATLPARVMGESWHKASALGALMNTRGLMELIILNVGLELNVITPTLFSMMIVMALSTTFMTSPCLDWIIRRSKTPQPTAATT